jgi:hypothetical protein
MIAENTNNFAPIPNLSIEKLPPSTLRYYLPLILKPAVNLGDDFASALWNEAVPCGRRMEQMPRGRIVSENSSGLIVWIESAQISKERLTRRRRSAVIWERHDNRKH